MKLLEILQNRHSVRTYADDKISDEQLQMILSAGLLSASSRSIRPWELIVVRNRDTLRKLSSCRNGAANMLNHADAAVVVIADSTRSDVWVEDCSIVMSNMHLMADSIGVGSCWIQGRLREAADGQKTETYVRSLLKFPENYSLEAILSLGIPEKHAPKTELSELRWEKVHNEVF